MEIEDALQQDEERVDGLRRSAKRYLTALNTWKGACQHGHIANRQKAAALATELANGLSGPTEEAASAWTFDVRTYLETADWRDEVRAVARERFSLGMLDENETLISSPVVVRAQPGRNALQIGRNAWPNLRPRVVAAELKRLRDRTEATSVQELVESLYAVYKRMKTEDAIFVRFRDIYDLFSLTPGWKKDNPQAAFAQEIYAVHRAGSTTRAGAKPYFIYPTATYKAGDIFPVIAEDGRTILYHGIRFEGGK